MIFPPGASLRAHLTSYHKPNSLCVLLLRAQSYRPSLPDEMARPTIDIDEQIDRLRAGGTLTENEVKALCEKVRRTCGDQTGSALRPTPPRWGSCHVFSGRFFDMAAGHQGDMHGGVELDVQVLLVGSGGPPAGWLHLFRYRPQSDTNYLRSCRVGLMPMPTHFTSLTSLFISNPLSKSKCRPRKFCRRSPMYNPSRPQ